MRARRCPALTQRLEQAMKEGKVVFADVSFPWSAPRFAMSGTDRAKSGTDRAYGASFLFDERY
eukprot:1689618-Rhodomonas_salina.1